MSAPMCGDCLISLDQCAHAVEYITQRRAIATLRKANAVMAQMFNTEEEEEVAQ
jgi:hypothetical protein